MTETVVYKENVINFWQLIHLTFLCRNLARSPDDLFENRKMILASQFWGSKITVFKQIRT